MASRARTTSPGTGSAGRRAAVLELARATRGFMPEEEGLALADAARRASSAGAGSGERAGAGARAVMVEIGAWCGKSTLYLGLAAEETGAVLFSVDHHRGSEENQAGWEHHDAQLVGSDGRLETLPHWRRAVSDADLEESVVGVVGDSRTVASCWHTPLALCFIDGGHGSEPAWADYREWAPWVAPGGLLAIHDVFPDPADGGRPPYELFCDALDSGKFVEETACGSLRVLRRCAAAR